MSDAQAHVVSLERYWRKKRGHAEPSPKPLGCNPREGTGPRRDCPLTMACLSYAVSESWSSFNCGGCWRRETVPVFVPTRVSFDGVVPLPVVR